MEYLGVIHVIQFGVIHFEVLQTVSTDLYFADQINQSLPTIINGTSVILQYDNAGYTAQDESCLNKVLMYNVIIKIKLIWCYDIESWKRTCKSNIVLMPRAQSKQQKFSISTNETSSILGLNNSKKIGIIINNIEKHLNPFAAPLL